MWYRPKFPVNLSSEGMCEYCAIETHDNFLISQKDFRKHRTNNEDVDSEKVGKFYAIHRNKKLRKGSEYPRLYDPVNSVHIREYSYYWDEKPIDDFDRYALDGYVSISSSSYRFADANKTDEEIIKELREGRLRQLKAEQKRREERENEPIWEPTEEMKEMLDMGKITLITNDKFDQYFRKKKDEGDS